MTRAILFDLDGTFADTAPDLAFALNSMRQARGMAALPLAATRPVTSLGARGLLNVGFNLTPEDADYQRMREEFLGIYRANLCRDTRLFPGIERLLDALEARGVRWGIVTNKAEGLTRPLLSELHIGHRAACIIGGDTTGKTKPHPAPLLAASRVLDLPPAACLYVGDDRRDVEAAHAAGMPAFVAQWGYLNGSDPENWGADGMIERPLELLNFL